MVSAATQRLTTKPSRSSSAKGLRMGVLTPRGLARASSCVSSTTADKGSRRLRACSSKVVPLERHNRSDKSTRGLRKLSSSHVSKAFALDQAALGSACSTTYKLVLLCAVISRLMKIQMLPKDTPVILSKVAFNVLLPCLLCSKVAVTLIKLGDPSMLGVPIVGILQIAVGLAAGAFLFAITERFIVKKAVPEAAVAVAVGTSNGVDVSSTIASASTNAQDDERTRKTMKSIVKAACAFGNSVTLPLIFFSTLLSGAAYDLAAGYTALFLIAWSPALWSLGYSMFVAEDKKIEETDSDKSTGMQKLTKAVVGLATTIRSYINPPMIGVLLGVLIGLTPLSQIFFPATEGLKEASFATKFSIGLSKGAMELVELLAGALLAIQTMVLAASLLPTDGPKDKPINWKELLSPQSKLEVAALIIILIVRFLVVPFAGLGLVNLFQTMNWLPQDPICYLVVLVQAVMPSAQNIVLLMNLQSSTRPLAPTMARILLQLYLLSVVPLALWMGTILPMINLAV